MMNAFLLCLISLSKKQEKNLSLIKSDFCTRKNLYDEWKISKAQVAGEWLACAANSAKNQSSPELGSISLTGST